MFDSGVPVKLVFCGMIKEVPIVLAVVLDELYWCPVVCGNVVEVVALVWV